MTNRDLATCILKNIGGQENIKSITHCVTRLRFVLYDTKKVNKNEIEKLEGIIGTQEKGGQFQVIIGGKVVKVYNEILDITGLTGDEVQKKEENQDKSLFSRILKTLSGILIPSLPPIIGGGMIKGFLFMFWQFGWIQWGDPVFNLLNIISDGMFYFYPFLLAVSAAKEFKTNQYMALAIAGSLMHPTIYEGIAEGLSSFSVFGINIPLLDYNSSVIPIILAVWAMSYVYRFFEKRIPDIVSVIFTPMLTLLIIIPISLVAIAPIGFYTGEYIAQGIEWLIQLNPIIAGFVIGATRPFLVFTGTHHAVRAIVAQQLASNGRTTIGAMNYMSVMAQAAAALAVFIVLRNRDKKMRDISLSAAVSGFLGVTEPALYGVIIKYKVVIVAVAIGGGVGAAISSAFGGAEYAMVMSSIVTIPATFGEGFMGIAIGIPAAIMITMLIIFIFKNQLYEENNVETKQESKLKKRIPEQSLNEKLFTVLAPINGKLKDLSDVDDITFASRKMGEGIAIESNETTIVSPVDGIITAIYPTKHAIGITSNDGVEVLIHIGIDTVNLKGKYFTQLVQDGDNVKKGDKLISFDRKAIEQEAKYNLDIIVIILNQEQFLDTIPNTKDSTVNLGDTILTIIQ